MQANRGSAVPNQRCPTLILEAEGKPAQPDVLPTVPKFDTKIDWFTAFLREMDERVKQLPLNKADRTCIQIVLDELRGLASHETPDLAMLFFAGYLHLAGSQFAGAADKPTSHGYLYAIAARIVDEECRKILESSQVKEILPTGAESALANKLVHYRWLPQMLSKWFGTG